MKTISSIVLMVTLVFGIAFAQDEMEFGLRKIRHRKKVEKKTPAVQMAKSQDLGKKLNLKAKKVAKVKPKKKKSKKYGEVNDMFANVEYNNYKKKTKRSEDDFFNELKDLSDLDQVDKYERKFVKAEGSRAKNRRKKQDAFVAKNAGAEPTSFAAQAGGSNLKNAKPVKKSVVQGTVAGTTFDSFENDFVEPSVVTQPESAKTSEPAPLTVQKSSTVYESVPVSYSKSNSWISIAPVGGYGVVSLTDSSDQFNRGAKEWEASDSFTGGVIADIGRGRWQLETGLLYVRSGIKREVQNFALYGTGDNYMEYVDRDYVAIPLVGIYNFMERYTSSLFAKAGLWPLIMTSARQETYGTLLPDASSDVGNLYQKYEVLATLGVGGRIKVSDAMAIIIEGYFLRGLSDTFSANGMSGTTQGFIGNVGISFDL